MRTKLPFLVVLGMTMVSLISVHAQSFLTNGLVAYYPFNGNAGDASGNGNHGTNRGAVAVADRFMSPASAFLFDGTNAFVDCGNPASVNFGYRDFTLSAWVKTLGDQSRKYVVGKYSTPQPIAYGLGTVGSSTEYAFIYGQSSVTDISGGAPLSDGRWHQIIAVYERAANLTIYSDGVKNGQANISAHSSANITNALPLLIGKISSGYWFGGSIDDVRIYNRALSASEVQQLYGYESTCQIPRRAAATAQIVNGFFVGVTITDGGCGYTNSPLVLVVGGGGSGATAQATVSNGQVTGITILTTGSGYTSVPEIRIASPPFIPKLNVETSRVRVNLDLVLGRRYQLQSSGNLTNWTNVGTAFVADSERISQLYDVDTTGRYFRIQEVP